MTAELTKATENVNTVSNIKTITTMCTKDLKKRLAKEERDLKSLINKRMNDTIINAQREIIAQLQQDIAQVESKKLASTVALNDDVITFRLAKDGKEVSKKIALVKNNRVINSKKVDEFIAVLHCPLLVCACNEVLEAGGVGGVAGDGNVNALSLHDCNAFENVVRAVALHLCLLTVGVRCFADYVELAGVEVILRLHISEAVDAGNDHGGILAEAVEDNAKGLFANLVCRTRDADCAFSGCERLMAGKESKALCFVL